jgi:hypothetical protein
MRNTSAVIPAGVTVANVVRRKRQHMVPFGKQQVAAVAA